MEIRIDQPVDPQITSLPGDEDLPTITPVDRQPEISGADDAPQSGVDGEVLPGRTSYGPVLGVSWKLHDWFAARFDADTDEARSWVSRGVQAFSSVFQGVFTSVLQRSEQMLTVMQEQAQADQMNNRDPEEESKIITRTITKVTDDVSMTRDMAIRETETTTTQIILEDGRVKQVIVSKGVSQSPAPADPKPEGHDQ